MKEQVFCDVAEDAAMNGNFECFRLVRPNYGLKQASRGCNKALDELLCSIELKAPAFDPCFAQKSTRGCVFIY